MKKLIKKHWKLVLALILGNFIYSFGVIAFIEPNGLITGGVTGISLFLHYIFTDIPVALFALILNFVFFFGLSFGFAKFAALTFHPYRCKYTVHCRHKE